MTAIGLPASLKYGVAETVRVGQLPKEKIHEYWRKPSDGVNLPQEYLQGEERSQFLVDLIRRHAPQDVRILEIGCNVGRNLQHLLTAGYANLEGIEISEDAVRLLESTFPELAQRARIHNAPAEDVLPTLEDGRYDLTFTMAVLEHIHRESEWIFPHIVRITKNVLVTVEDEKNVSERHFPRNYRKVFEGLGLRQVEQIGGRKIPGIESPYFVARVFRPLGAAGVSRFPPG